MKEIIQTKNKSGYKVPLLSLDHKFVKKDGQYTNEKLLKVHDHFLNTILPEI